MCCLGVFGEVAQSTSTALGHKPGLSPGGEKSCSSATLELRIFLSYTVFLVSLDPKSRSLQDI